MSATPKTSTNRDGDSSPLQDEKDKKDKKDEKDDERRPEDTNKYDREALTDLPLYLLTGRILRDKRSEHVTSDISLRCDSYTRPPFTFIELVNLYRQYHVPCSAAFFFTIVTTFVVLAVPWLAFHWATGYTYACYNCSNSLLMSTSIPTSWTTVLHPPFAFSCWAATAEFAGYLVWALWNSHKLTLLAQGWSNNDVVNLKNYPFPLLAANVTVIARVRWYVRRLQYFVSNAANWLRGVDETHGDHPVDMEKGIDTETSSPSPSSSVDVYFVTHRLCGPIGWHAGLSPRRLLTAFACSAAANALLLRAYWVLVHSLWLWPLAPCYNFTDEKIVKMYYYYGPRDLVTAAVLWGAALLLGHAMQVYYERGFPDRKEEAVSSSTWNVQENAPAQVSIFEKTMNTNYWLTMFLCILF